MLLAVAVAAVLLGSGPPVQAELTITGTFDSSFSASFGANAAAAEAAWNNAAAVLMNTYSASPSVQNASINITVSAVADQSIFGQSSGEPLYSFGYAPLMANYATNAMKSGNPDQLLSVSASGSLGQPNPDPSGTYWLFQAQAKALGLIPQTGTDGQTTFGAGFNWNFNQSGTTGSQYYFEGVALHEITEVMGRVGLESGTIGTTPDSHSIVDLFAYTGPGARSPTVMALSSPSTMERHCSRNITTIR